MLARRILCLGHAAHDTIYRVAQIPTTPTKVPAVGYAECGGGMAANASVAAARLGADVRYVGRVGDDALGSRILEDLAQEGVNVRGVKRIAGCRSSSAAILVDGAGERLICSYNDPNLDLDADWFPLTHVQEVDAVLADVRWPAGAARVLDEARRLGKPAVLDGDVGHREVLCDLAGRATHTIFSATGLAIIYLT
jgi:sulfofructose kinase